MSNGPRSASRVKGWGVNYGLVVKYYTRACKIDPREYKVGCQPGGSGLYMVLTRTGDDIDLISRSAIPLRVIWVLHSA